MGKNFAHSGRVLLAAVMIPSLVLGTLPVEAQVSTLQDQATIMLPEIGLEGAGPACSDTMSQALNSAGQYSTNQTNMVAQGFMRAPTSYFSCLQPILSTAQGLLNAFNGTGNLSIGGLLTALAAAAVGSMVQQLAAQACGAVSSVLASVPGWQLLTIPTAGGKTQVQQSSVSGMTLGTSVTNMVGAAPAVIDPTASGSQLQTGNMVLAQESMGQSVAALNGPTTSPTDPQRYGPHTPTNYTPPVNAAPMSLADQEFENPPANPEIPPLPAPVTNPSLPAPSLVPTSTPQTPAAGTSAHGGTIVPNLGNVVMGKYYGANQNCVQMVIGPSPPALANLPHTGNYPSMAPWHGGDYVQNSGDLSPGTIIATFLGPGGNFNAPTTTAVVGGATKTIYHQHGCIYLSQNGQGIYVLEQYVGSGGARHQTLYWNSGKDGMQGSQYQVVLH